MHWQYRFNKSPHANLVRIGVGGGQYGKEPRAESDQVVSGITMAVPSCVSFRPGRIARGQAGA
jgi:hypothetical protein